MFTEQITEVTSLIRYMHKLTHYAQRKQTNNSQIDEKLFSSPKKPGKEYARALMELKGYVKFFMSDLNINTGKEIHDIKKAVDSYINPTPGMRRTLESGGGVPPHKVFITQNETQQTFMPAPLTLPVKITERYPMPKIDEDVLEFNRQIRKPEPSPEVLQARRAAE